VLGAVYMLWMYQRVIFGPLSNPANEKLEDLSRREGIVLAPILALIVIMGVYPRPFLRMIEASVNVTLERAQVRTAPAGITARPHTDASVRTVEDVSGCEEVGAQAGADGVCSGGLITAQAADMGELR